MNIEEEDELKNVHKVEPKQEPKPEPKSEPKNKSVNSNSETLVNSITRMENIVQESINKINNINDQITQLKDTLLSEHTKLINLQGTLYNTKEQALLARINSLSKSITE